MPEPHELPWDPLTPGETLAVFADWDRFWCKAGGWSIGGPLDTLANEIDGVPVIAPEIQLLYKGNTTNRAGRRPKDDADFRTALPCLPAEQRAWLREALASREPGHPWLAALTT